MAILDSLLYAMSHCHNLVFSCMNLIGLGSVLRPNRLESIKLDQTCRISDGTAAKLSFVSVDRHGAAFGSNCQKLAKVFVFSNKEL